MLVDFRYVLNARNTLPDRNTVSPVNARLWRSRRDVRLWHKADQFNRRSDVRY
jgi:hypothetical protein